MLSGTQRFAARLQRTGIAPYYCVGKILVYVQAGTTVDGHLLSERGRMRVDGEGWTCSLDYDIPTSVTGRSATHHQV